MRMVYGYQADAIRLLEMVHQMVNYSWVLPIAWDITSRLLDILS